MLKYPLQLQIRVDKKTVQQIRSISKRHRRSMSEVVRLMIEREACQPSDPATLLIPCEKDTVSER
jgi:antitoxin component of RelBE/YafQ-DinJ toxin-antitoxin module